MGERTAFFYGTLMSPAILHRVIFGDPHPPPALKERLSIRPAHLQGFRRHRVRGADFPAIIPHPETAKSDGVRGTIVTGLNKANVAHLDVFEGDMYERQFVKVSVLGGHGKGETVEVETYVWCLGEKRLEPTEWNFEEFMREKASSWIGVEREDYEDADEVDEEGLLHGEDVVTARDITKATHKGNGVEPLDRDEPMRSAV